MNEKISVVSIIVNHYDGVEKVNSLLHEYRDFIIGRFGLPLKEKQISVINVVISATESVTKSLAEKLRTVTGVVVGVLTGN